MVTFNRRKLWQTIKLLFLKVNQNQPQWNKVQPAAFGHKVPTAEQRLIKKNTRTCPLRVLIFFPEKKKEYSAREVWNWPWKKSWKQPEKKNVPEEKTAKFNPRKKIFAREKKKQYFPRQNPKSKLKYSKISTWEKNHKPEKKSENLPEKT